MARPRSYYDYPLESNDSNYWHIFNIARANSPSEKMAMVKKYMRLFFQDQIHSELVDIYSNAWRSCEAAKPIPSQYGIRNAKSRSTLAHIMSQEQGETVRHMCMQGLGIPELRSQLFGDRMISELATEIANEFRITQEAKYNDE